jgi:hypothetical protein
MTDFDFTDVPEQEAVEQTAPDKPLSWYQRNKEYMREKRKRDYAANKNGVRDKKAAARKISRENEREAQRAYLDENREKVNARRREYYRKNADKMKPGFSARYHSDKDAHTSQRLKRKFGITLEDYNAMFALQKGNCAVCGTKQKIKDKYGNLRRLAVDHDHKTGKVRQLLCGPCNTSIGLIKENVKTLNKMIDYIKKHEDTNVKTVTIVLTIDELQAVAGLIDAGIKSVGLSGVKAAASILTKLEAAVAEANANEPKETE